MIRHGGQTTAAHAADEAPARRRRDALLVGSGPDGKRKRTDLLHHLRGALGSTLSLRDARPPRDTSGSGCCCFHYY
ncbi:hypothetical protein MRX96_010811 [Rhipicephalus microplus]